MTTNPRTPKASANRRRDLVVNDLLDTATEVFAVKGYENTSLQDIADAAGLSRPTLYYYLNGKEDLLVMLVDQLSGGLVDIVTRLHGRTDLSSAEKIGELTEQLVRQRLEHPGHFRILDRSEALLPEPTRSQHMKAKRQIVQVLIDIIEQGIAAGEFTRVEPRTAAFSLLGMCNWVAWWVRPADVGKADAIVATIRRLATSMLAAIELPFEASPATLVQEIRERLDRLEAGS